MGIIVGVATLPPQTEEKEARGENRAPVGGKLNMHNIIALLRTQCYPFANK